MEYLSSIIVGAIVLGLVILALYSIYRDKKNGKCCGGGCGDCTSCPGRKNKQDFR